MLQRLAKERGSKITQVSQDAMQVLCRYSWPGNVRELENAIQRSVVLAQGDTILKKDLPQDLLDLVGSRTESTGKGQSAQDEPDVETVGSGETTSEPEKPLGVQALPYDELMDLAYEHLRQKHSENLVQAIERELMMRALEETGGNQVKTSNLLGITRTTLRKRIEAYDLGDS